MPIGSSFKLLAHKKLSYFFIKFIGTNDLHSHIRLKPVLYNLKKELNSKKRLSILEIGCGNGIIAFELLSDNLNFEYLGLDNNVENIRNAKRLLDKYNVDNISFTCLNVENLNVINFNKKFDIILLIDVIEHIGDPGELLQKIIRQFNKSGKIIISVPTQLYPIVFGKAFHEKVGHLVDGYSLNILDKMMNKTGCEQITCGYNTGLFSNVGCALFYRIPYFNNYWENIKTLFFIIFRYLDFINNSKVSCSLFAIYKLKIDN